MWVSHVPSRTIVDCTPTLGRMLDTDHRALIGTYIQFSGQTKEGKIWYSETRKEAERINDDVCATGRTDTRKIWTRTERNGTLRKLIITRSRLDAEHTLAVTHDITEGDVRIQWLERVDFERRSILLPNGNTLTFKMIEALGLYVRGFSGANSATALNTSRAAVKKRLEKCRDAFEVDNLEELRLTIGLNGLANLLLINLAPPLQNDLALRDVLEILEK